MILVATSTPRTLKMHKTFDRRLVSCDKGRQSKHSKSMPAAPKQWICRMMMALITVQLVLDNDNPTEEDWVDAREMEVS